MLYEVITSAIGPDFFSLHVGDQRGAGDEGHFDWPGEERRLWGSDHYRGMLRRIQRPRRRRGRGKSHHILRGHFRITSYNVCYTKLLRSWKVRERVRTVRRAVESRRGYSGNTPRSPGEGPAGVPGIRAISNVRC